MPYFKCLWPRQQRAFIVCTTFGCSAVAPKSMLLWWLYQAYLRACLCIFMCVCARGWHWSPTLMFIENVAAHKKLLTNLMRTHGYDNLFFYKYFFFWFWFCIFFAALNAAVLRVFASIMFCLVFPIIFSFSSKLVICIIQFFMTSVFFLCN